MTAVLRVLAKRTKSGVQVPPEMKEPTVRAIAALRVSALPWSGVKWSRVFQASGLSTKTLIAENPPPMAMAGTAMTETMVNALIPQYAEAVMRTPAMMIGIQMLQLYPLPLRKA